MAKLTKDEIKIFLGINQSKIEYDDIIQNAIDFAYGYLDAWVGINEEERFKEYGIVRYDEKGKKYIDVSGVAKDINLYIVKIEDCTLNLEEDLLQRGFSTWEIVNDLYLSNEYNIFFVEYKSSNLIAKVKKILIEIIIFEVQKMPIINNSISTKIKSIEGTTTEQFVSDDIFYKHINDSLNKLFVRGL